MKRPHTKLAGMCVPVATAALLASCTVTGGFFGRSDSGADRPSQEASPSTQIDGSSIALYLETLQTLIEGDSLAQSDTLQRVAEAADFAPTTTNRLLYALVLALPGHPGSDAEEGQRRLAAIIAADGSLLPAEQMLATILLRDVEQRLILEVAAADLRSRLAAEQRNNAIESQRRIQALLAENQRLTAELEDAVAKLDEITSIEQSIRELENDAD